MKKSSFSILLAAVIAATAFPACDKASAPSVGSCIYFGSYPTNEVVSGPFLAVDGYALDEGDVIVDAALYAKLEQALWNENDDTEIDGRRYHRLRGDGAVTVQHRGVLRNGVHHLDAGGDVAEGGVAPI